MGDIDDTGPVQWLRLESDDDCDPATPLDNVTGLDAASRPFGTRCFIVEMGTKGGAARDQDEIQFSFNEGTGSSQMGSLWLRSGHPQRPDPHRGRHQGLRPRYTGRTASTPTPLCPDKNIMYNLPNPGPVRRLAPDRMRHQARDGLHEPARDGLDDRILGGTRTCPADVPRYMPNGTSILLSGGAGTTGTRNNNDCDDDQLREHRRLAADWQQASTRRIRGSSRCSSRPTTPSRRRHEKEYPIVALGSFYITGWGRLNGSATSRADVPTTRAPTATSGTRSTASRGAGQRAAAGSHGMRGNCSGVAVWGHFIQGVVTGGGGTGSGEALPPFQGSLQVCIPSSSSDVAALDSCNPSNVPK